MVDRKKVIPRRETSTPVVQAPLPPPRRLPKIPVPKEPEPDESNDSDDSDEEFIDRDKYFSVVGSKISLFSYEDMKSLAGNIIIDKIKKGKDDNYTGTLYDPRMGPMDYRSPCVNCKLENNCPGHFGIIHFNTYVINPLYIREIISVLSSVCGTCKSLLLPKQQIISEGIDKFGKKKRLKIIAEKSMKLTKCTNIFESGKYGAIEKCKPKEIIFDKAKSTDMKAGIIKYRKGDSDPQPFSNKKIYEILSSIPPEDYKILGFTEDSPPANMILQAILVMPTMIRPISREGDNEMDNNFTRHYNEILKTTLSREGKQEQNYSSDIYKSIYNLYRGGTENTRAAKNLRSVKDYLQGKGGMVRKQIMGRPNDYCARTVAGPGTDIPFDSVLVPRAWQSILTQEVKINDRNIDTVRKWLEQGIITHIIRKNSEAKIVIFRMDNYVPEIGDKVERQLQDGDWVMINRQPSLHKTSMMARKVILSDDLTIKVHLSHVTPMNADFDGDEMNLHRPRNELVMAESRFILSVTNNLMSFENNAPTMGLVMNSITGAYLLAKSEKLLTPIAMTDLVLKLRYKGNLPGLTERLRKYNVNPLSGKALLSTMFPPDFTYFSGNDLYIAEGVVVTSHLTKSQVGPSERSVIQDLYKQYGPVAAVRFLTDAPILINSWLITTGFSVGYDDCINIEIDPKTGKEYNVNQIAMDAKLAEIDDELMGLDYSAKDPIQKRVVENKIISILNGIQTTGANLIKDQLRKKNNSIGVMTEEGAKSKGNNANFTQMVASVGQQFLRGQRLSEAITNNSRSLPVFDPHDIKPEARGFVRSSYFSGLNPVEFYFIHLAGRENLADTALKTADTGSLQRHMMKAFEIFLASYDGSMRTVYGSLYDPCFNSGYSINKMVKTTNPKTGETVISFMDLISTMKRLNIKYRDRVNPIEARTNVVSEAKTGEPGATARNSEGVKEPESVFDQFEKEEVDTPSIHVPKNPEKKITIFEKTKLIGARAMQISNNAQIMVDLPEDIIDPVEIANREYDAGVLPLYVIRRYPNGVAEKVYPTLDLI